MEWEGCSFEANPSLRLAIGKTKNKGTIYPDEEAEPPSVVELFLLLQILWEQDPGRAEKLWLLPRNLASRTGSLLSGRSKICSAQGQHFFPRSCISSLSDALSPDALQALLSSGCTYVSKVQIHKDCSRIYSIINQLSFQPRL